MVIFIHSLGISLTLGYGIYHLVSDITSIGLFSLAAGIVGCASLCYFFQQKNNPHLLLIFVLLLGAAILLTSYHYGYRGLIFVFPFTASLFYLLDYKAAIFTAIAFSLTSLQVAINVMDNITVFRYFLAIATSVGLSICYAFMMRQQRKKLEQDAHHDALTGITNRRQFNYWLNSVIEKKIPSKKIALFYIDIDDFKHVNDSFGHALGDELLKQFSERMLTVIRQNELIMATHKIYNFGRLAGDEFVIAILDLDDVGGAKKIAERLIESTSLPFMLTSATVKIHISVGVVYSEGNISAEMLLHNADSSMYKAKENGKNNYYVFDDTISDEIERRKDIENNITRTLDNNLFSLAYMPIFSISDEPKISGVEALIRCNEDYFKGVGPEKFIPVAEASGQIKEIDLWVMETAFNDISGLKNKPNFDTLWYAINISSTELLDTSFINQIERLLKEFSIDPKMIHLEITETKLVPYENVIIDRMNRLREMDFHLSLDDYGTGYTGFAQLLNFPGDYIKIDRSFISEIGKGESNYTKMIGVMLSIAKIYGLKVIAEGVETEHQLNYLRGLGCQYAQGYYFSKPLDLDSFVDSVDNRNQ
ncbi:MAG: diguanylate cyclase (GGDEF)-like protein [Cellvibrionaceae bacterium]